MHANLKKQNSQPNLHLKEQRKLKVSRQKEITMIRTEIIEKVSETKSWFFEKIKPSPLFFGDSS